MTRPGGLYIIGSERHESRRIDNQLRGRSGRQGDPGRSKFFLSLEDDLMRIFGSDRLDSMLTRLGLKEGEAIIHPWINKALEKAQQKVEARNFDIRKNLLKFDNVQNDQRKVIFDQRIDLMKDESVAETVADMRHAFVEDVVTKHVPEHAYAEQWDVAGLKEELKRVLDVDLPVDEWAKEEGIADEELLTRIEQRVDEHMAAKVAQWGPDVMRYVEKTILLQTLDHLWREHLIMLDHLRQVIGLRGYGQRDPLAGIQVGGVQPVRGDDRASARGGDGATDARRDRAAGRAAAGVAGDGSAQARSEYRRGRDGVRQCLAGAGRPPPTAIRRTPRAGARSAATRIAPAAPARSTSTATASMRELAVISASAACKSARDAIDASEVKQSNSATVAVAASPPRVCPSR